MKVSPVHCHTLDKRKEVWLPNENRDMRWSSLTEKIKKQYLIPFFLLQFTRPSILWPCQQWATNGLKDWLLLHCRFGAEGFTLLFGTRLYQRNCIAAAELAPLEKRPLRSHSPLPWVAGTTIKPGL